MTRQQLRSEKTLSPMSFTAEAQRTQSWRRGFATKPVARISSLRNLGVLCVSAVKKHFAFSVLAVCFFLLAPPVSAQRQKAKPQPPRVFTFDATNSEIAVILTQEGLISRRYPTHRVLAKSFNGKIVLPKDETKLTAELEADPKQLTNVDAAMGDFERKEFHNVLRNQILEVDKFPSIKFVSVSVTDVQRDGDKRSFTLTGDLTVHGTTKRVSFPVAATLSENELRAAGEEKLKLTDFGLKPFEKGMGLIKVADELKVSFNVVAKIP